MTQQPVVMAFLQNQWFRDPERARQIREREEWRSRPRHDWNRTWLFWGCLTGKRLETALGEELCQTIIWENISPEIAGTSTGSFPADHKHIKLCLEENPPALVLAFGRPATEALAAFKYDLSTMPGGCPWLLHTCCHPTARGASVLEQLATFGRRVHSTIEELQKPNV